MNRSEMSTVTICILKSLDHQLKTDLRLFTPDPDDMNGITGPRLLIESLLSKS